MPYFQRGGTFYNGRLNMSNMKRGCMCRKRGEGEGGSCITWDLKVAFHLFDVHVSRGGILNHGRQIVKELRYRQSINNPLKVVYQLFFKGDSVTQWFGVHT